MIEFKKLIDAKALYQELDKIWVAKGMTFFAIDYNGKRVSRKYRIGGWKDRLMSWHRLPSQLLRVGIHHLLPLKNGNLLVVVKRKLYILSSEGKVLNAWSEFKGNKPVHQGVCVTPEGTIFFGEYVLNPNRDMVVKLWRWYVVRGGEDICFGGDSSYPLHQVGCLREVPLDGHW